MKVYKIKLYYRWFIYKINRTLNMHKGGEEIEMPVIIMRLNYAIVL
jgi:hypothetical protein